MSAQTFLVRTMSDTIETDIQRVHTIAGEILPRYGMEPLKHLGLWEKSHAPPDKSQRKKEITFDPSCGSINSPSRGRSRDSQLI